jgi:GNAT superfamily N-acetyltransferase
MAIITRTIENGDAKAVSMLSEQLCYAISKHDTAAQILQIKNSANDIAYVAVDGTVVIGWIHLFYALRLESQPFCEVAGLVVDEQYRGKGVGKLLLEKAEDWSMQRNCKRLVVRSNAKRNEAHQFYINQGFKEIKQQKVFELTLV